MMRINDRTTLRLCNRNLHSLQQKKEESKECVKFDPRIRENHFGKKDNSEILQERIKQAVITSNVDNFVNTLDGTDMIEIFKMIKTFRKIRNKVMEILFECIKKREYELIVKNPFDSQKFLCHPLKETILFDMSMSDRFEYLIAPPCWIKDDEYEKMCNVVGDMMKLFI